MGYSVILVSISLVQVLKGCCVQGKLDRGSANALNKHAGQDPCDLASNLQLPGTENIDNDPAFAPYCRESDEEKQSFGQLRETMGCNWSYNGAC